METLINLIALTLGGLVVFKSLTYIAGPPHVTPIPKHPDYFGDDQMTFLQELHTTNRLGTEPLKAKSIDNRDGLNQISINNAIYEHNDEHIINLKKQIPPTRFIKEW